MHVFQPYQTDIAERTIRAAFSTEEMASLQRLGSTFFGS